MKVLQEEKLVEGYSEEEIKEMWKKSFFWVVENRPEWLKEVIAEKKMSLKIRAKKGG